MGLIHSIYAHCRAYKVLLLGLDVAGKTTILYRLKMNQTIMTIPTIGLNVEHIKYKKINTIIWDLGGQDKIRPLWKHYYKNTEAVIFVIDAYDVHKYDEAKRELHLIMSDEALKNVPILILVNKIDLMPTKNINMFIDLFDINKFPDHLWCIQCTSAINGEGLKEGFDWLCNKMKEKPHSKT